MYQKALRFVQRYINSLHIFRMYECISSLFTLISIYICRQPLFQQEYDDNMIEYSEVYAENFITSQDVVSMLFANNDSESLKEEEMATDATNECVSQPIKHEESKYHDGNIDINRISAIVSVEDPSMTKYWDKTYIKSYLALGGSLLLLLFIAVIIFFTLKT